MAQEIPNQQLNPHIKRYKAWYRLKKQIHERGVPAHIKSREVWWVSTGHNIGYEEDGKHDNFERPVLIVKVFSTELFFGIPLTSKDKKTPYHFKLEYNGIKSVAMLSQARAFSTKRVINKAGVVPIDMYKDMIGHFISNVIDNNKKPKK